MKNRKKRFCPHCKNAVVREKHKEIDYPYLCKHCDENLYTFETFKSKRKIRK